MVYQYKDHLRNNRVSFGRNSAEVLEITDANDYYPFGMNHLKTENAYFGGGSYKNFKYQGQELQETGFYSFKWRDYMPDVGRFFNIDPLSEKYAFQSHYNFSENRVTTYRELEGLETYEEPFDPMEEEMRESEESPLVRRARFNPETPESYRRGNEEPLITPELLDEKVHDIEEVVVNGTKETKDFISRAIDWIGNELTGGENTSTDAQINNRHNLDSDAIAKSKKTAPGTFAPREMLKQDIDAYNAGSFSKTGNKNGDVSINGRIYGTKNNGGTLFPRSGGAPEFIDLTRGEIKAIQLMKTVPAERLDQVIKNTGISNTDANFAKEFIKKY